MSGGGTPTLFDATKFEDGKAPDALRTIGEVASALGIRQHVLRYWEEQFPLLRPLKRSGGRRYYRPADVPLVETIDRLVHREGYTLRGARLVLEGRDATGEAGPAAPDAAGGPADASQDAPATMATDDNLVARMRAIRDRLAAALDA
ncbi:MAG: MerR family transcriptional regulator [Sphingomonadales bacterium]|nr:MerR family transcriptional regulator [Sphingomonadales bacterium]